MQQISAPYPYFPGRDGKPLSDGSIYIGIISLNPVTSQIQVYWDEAGTMPAVQPIMTQSGYPMRNGTPARIYTATDDYSMSVYDKKGGLVSYVGSVTSNATLRTDLSASAGSGLVGFLYAATYASGTIGKWLQDLATSVGSTFIGFIQAGTGAVLRTLQSKLRDVVSVKDFGAVGDGTTDDTAAVQAAINSGAKEVVVTAGGIYKITTTLTVSSKLKLSGKGELRWTAGITTASAISVTVDGCEFDGIFMTNPNFLQAQSGGKNAGIVFAANFGTVLRSTIQYFQNGIQALPSGEYHDFLISNNKIIDCLGAGDGPLDATSAFGEDRGDGITIWGCCATITGNLVTAKSGQDCRIGIHVEALTVATVSYPLQDNLCTITGNLVHGAFRRGFATEQVNNTVITGNVCQGATWWGINLSRAQSAIVSDNAILFTRASADVTGAAWSPTRCGICVYGGAVNSMIINNTVDVSRGFADFGIYLQGLATDVATQTTQGATANGTATVALSAANSAIYVGQLITGTGVPASTYVVYVNGTALIASKNITAGTITLTFTVHDYAQHMTVSGNNILCNASNNAIGIGATYQEYPNISGNVIRFANKYGIYLYGTTDPIVNGNTVFGYKGTNNGIHLEINNGSVSVVGNVVNAFTAAGSIGIEATTFVGGCIANNFVRGCTTDVDATGSTYTSIAGNSSVGCTNHFTNIGGTGNSAAANTYS